MREDNQARRRQLEAAMEQRRELETAQASDDWKRLRRGWCWGAEGFPEELLERIGQKQGQGHYGEELRESDEQRAQRLLDEILRQAGWMERESRKRPKTDSTKARIAARLREQTPMTWEWIAERLAMGHWRTAANAVRKQA